MITLKNQVLNRPHEKPIVWDAFYKASNTAKPLVIFCHGYKGFKDWGCWNLVASSFSESHMVFIKFNFSHNGGTIENPIDFPDLEAFAENNYTKELEDLEAMLDHILSATFPLKHEIDTTNITLIGHSRGGGIAIIKASEDPRITKLITWASVSDFGKRTATSGELTSWKEKGVKYVLNSRTQQHMPHNYQFYLDFKANEQRLSIEGATKKLTIPFLIIHGIEDPSVKFNEADALHSFNPSSILLPIDQADHVFNARHPWHANEMPEALRYVVEKSLEFI